MEQIIDMLLSGLEQLSSGGLILIPLAFFSLWSHTIIIERAYHLRRERIIPSTFVTRSIYQELVQGNPEAAIKMCERRPGPLTNLLRAGIERRDADEETLKRVVRLAINDEKPFLLRYLKILSMLSPVAMYTGLLGTVIGMIHSFGALYSPDDVARLPAIAAGISEALITTAAGLIVALPSYVAYDYFSSKSQGFVLELERHGMSLVRFLATEEYKLFQEDKFEDIRQWKQTRND
jgi:biopolymer transport protein ExbB